LLGITTLDGDQLLMGKELHKNGGISVPPNTSSVVSVSLCRIVCLDSRGCFAKAPRFLQGTIEAQNPGFCFELLFRRGPSMNLFTSLVHFLRLTPSCKATTESGRKSTTSNSAQLNMQSGVAQDVVVEVDPIARPGTCPLCKSRPTTTCKELCTDRTTIVRRVFLLF
jgi:hypothetical protein